MHRVTEFPSKGGTIRSSFAVGLLAVATLAAAGLLLSRRRLPAPQHGSGASPIDVDDLYAAGL